MSNKRKKIVELFDYKLKLKESDYTKKYRLYMLKEYPMVEIIIKKIVQMPFCRQYYLKYPLDALLKGICKKMLINIYQLIVFGYFLSEVEWRLDSFIINTISQVFPNVIHVNQPTDPEKLKQISIFLYFSSYSIKQFLNEDISIYRQQMIKLIPQFQQIQNTWTNSQHTVGQILHPRLLNKFYQQALNIINYPNYNFCVDKILQISPCYDITAKNQKVKQLVTFGYMQINGQFQNQRTNYAINPNHNITDIYFQNHEQDNHSDQIKIEGIQQIDMNDFRRYDGPDF